MKKTKEMYGGGYYLLEGKAAANTAFIETTKHAKLFINLCSTYLSEYMKIHEYLIGRDGWMLQVTLNSKEAIYRSYEEGEKEGKRMKEILSEDEEWRVISERIRIMLSYYVRRTNNDLEREGTKVKESYKRYYFETNKEATKIMKEMQKQKIKMYQRKKKYRSVKGHYRIGKKLGKGHVFLCTRKLRRKGCSKKVELRCLNLLGSKHLVALNYVNSTIKLHNPTPYTQNSS